ncbi:MAG: replication initiator [Acidimicrobiales bacterium]
MVLVRFGAQDDIQGLIAGAHGADRAIGYLCKYLTKSIAGTHDLDGGEPSSERAAHINRLADEIRWLPCSRGVQACGRADRRRGGCRCSGCWGTTARWTTTRHWLPHWFPRSCRRGPKTAPTRADALV